MQMMECRPSWALFILNLSIEPLRAGLMSAAWQTIPAMGTAFRASLTPCTVDLMQHSLRRHVLVIASYVVLAMAFTTLKMNPVDSWFLPPCDRC
jgi:hypothetical protein